MTPTQRRVAEINAKESYAFACLHGLAELVALGLFFCLIFAVAILWKGPPC